MERGIRARALNRLTDLQARQWVDSGARESGKQLPKLSDGGGLFLATTKAGSFIWRVKYYHGGEERLYSIGQYPAVSLAAARTERDAIKLKIKRGEDPVAARRLDKAKVSTAYGNVFEDVARDWLQSRRSRWSGVHYEKSARAIERDVLPRLGKLPVGEIQPAMVTAVIESVTKRGAIDTAGKILQHVNGIFRLAQARGLRNDNPAIAVREVLPKQGKQKRRPALLEWSELGDVLRRAELARFAPPVRMAHRLCAFSACRLGNVVTAEWPEFHLDDEVPTWIIPRGKMKAQDRDHDHKVILGPTITAELKAWKALTGGSGFVFPSGVAQRKHITREAIEKAYRVTLKLEDKHTPHGWRAAFSTRAKENKHPAFDNQVVDLALDHVHDREVARAYDRGERLTHRVELMQWWDAELSQAQRGADVIPMAKQA